MFGLFISGLFPIETDLRISLAERDARHREIHTDLGTFALEVGAKIIQNILRNALRDADDMLGSPGHITGLLLELGSRSLALRAALGRGCALMYITADGANPLFDHIDNPPV